MNLYDNTFWMNIAAGIVFVALYIIAIRWARRKSKEAVYLDDSKEMARCLQVVEELLKCIKDSETLAELKMYQAEADDFFTFNYEIIGQKQAMEFYNRLTAAVIHQGQYLDARKPA